LFSKPELQRDGSHSVVVRSAGWFPCARRLNRVHDEAGRALQRPPAEGALVGDGGCGHVGDRLDARLDLEGGAAVAAAVGADRGGGGRPRNDGAVGVHQLVAPRRLHVVVVVGPAHEAQPAKRAQP